MAATISLPPAILLFPSLLRAVRRYPGSRGPFGRGSRHGRTTSHPEPSSCRRILWRWDHSVVGAGDAVDWAATVVVIAPTCIATVKVPLSKCMRHGFSR
jgi:hypothetical protein